MHFRWFEIKVSWYWCFGTGVTLILVIDHKIIGVGGRGGGRGRSFFKKKNGFIEVNPN